MDFYPVSQPTFGDNAPNNSFQYWRVELPTVPDAFEHRMDAPDHTTLQFDVENGFHCRTTKGM
ncbi:hypothetical protein AAVH_18080 [Aphelenchoides avenae]|nr:hypothetical protein AAVH_18080 [Aphelenchus avenae]